MKNFHNIERIKLKLSCFIVFHISNLKMNKSREKTSKFFSNFFFFEKLPQKMRIVPPIPPPRAGLEPTVASLFYH